MNGGNAMNARIALSLAAAISLTTLAGCASSMPMRATQPADSLAQVNEQREQWSLLHEGHSRWMEDDSPLGPSQALLSAAKSVEGVGSKQWTKTFAFGLSRR
jgi:hypothetical protein